MVALQTLALTLSLTGAGQTVLLDFYSDNCPPCRRMMPVIAQFEAGGYPVQKVNVDRQPQVAQQYGVQCWPTFLMLADGREVGRLQGMQTADQILALYQRAGFSPLQQQAAATRRPSNRSGPAAGARGVAADSSNRWTEARGAPAIAFDRADRRAEPAAPDAERLSAQQRAMAASVRIKIKDGRGYSYGSGTIVDTQDGEALVLTCGHLFRDSQGRGEITVDLFDKDGNHTGSTPGQVIRYDMERDVGLIAIRPQRKVAPVRVAGPRRIARRGDRVFSIGCNRGDPPTVRENRVTHINKYLGPANVEVGGAPIDGRSGGGLFSSNGELIGVCNAADPEDDEGLYAALETVQAELAAANLDFVYRGDNAQQLAAAPQDSPSARGAVLPRGMAIPSSLRGGAQAENRRSNDDTEVIVIVRSRSQPQQNNEVLFIRRPNDDLLRTLARQRDLQAGGADTSLMAVPARSSAVVRGQD